MTKKSSRLDLLRGFDPASPPPRQSLSPYVWVGSWHVELLDHPEFRGLYVKAFPRFVVRVGPTGSGKWAGVFEPIGNMRSRIYSPGHASPEAAAKALEHKLFAWQDAIHELFA